MSSMSEYVDKYVSLIMEYLQLCSNSEAIKNSEISNFIIGSGLVALDHIYSLAFSITNDLDVTAKYVNRGNSYFHEYLDQLNRTGMIQSVDCTDIVKFVYSKTVSEIYMGTNQNINSGFMHSVSHKPKYYICPRIVGIILWCSNSEISCLQRHEICYMYMLPILERTPCSALNEIMNMLEDLQTWNPNMKAEDYFSLLNAVNKYMKKITNSSRECTTLNNNQEGMVVESIKNKRIYMVANCRNKSLTEIMELEGYKNIGDIILK